VSLARPCFSAAIVLAAACSSGVSAGPTEIAEPTSDGQADAAHRAADRHGDDASAAPQAGASAPGATALTADACAQVTKAATLVVAEAPSADDYALTLEAAATSNTSWGAKGNEALVLEVLKNDALVGHLVLHQGATAFAYSMQVGALAAGDRVGVRLSPLSAAAAAPAACVGAATLRAAADFGAAAEGVRRAPVFKWPAAKRFDDLPVVLGWSKAKAHYQSVYTNENGGTVAQCGGGAEGMQAELARWGRGFDIEGIYSYGGTPSWGRCTGTASVTSSAPAMEGQHPIFYYGDGHNRLFESRGGYGKACGSGGPEKADGDLTGWNVQNPGNQASLDGPYVIVLRPLPVDLDALGFAAQSGRREALADTYAPWLYRLTALELAREGKVDGSRCRPIDQYVYADIFTADVAGHGDSYCSLGVQGGYKLRVTTSDGKTLSGPQMTKDYAGTTGWKRYALPLDRARAQGELTRLIFDAYDDDGIYFVTLGDVFVARPSGPNGATLEYLHRGQSPINVYVDDGNDGCAGGVNDDGPGGTAYACVGGQYTRAF
jgi:hypothetical protein